MNISWERSLLSLSSMSPFLAILERLVVALFSLLIVLILGLVILSCPIFFVSGVVLILASEATVMSGLYYIAFSILGPIVLIPTFLHVSKLADSDEFFEGKLIVPVVNVLITLACLLIFGPFFNHILRGIGRSLDSNIRRPSNEQNNSKRKQLVIL